MKNFAKFFVSVAVLFVGVSCATDSTEDLGQQVVGKGQTTITVSTGTRTSLGDKVDGEYPVYWSNGDQLSLNGVASAPLADVEANSTTASFTWEGTFDAPFCVAYPASDEGTVTFAAEQSYVEGTFSQNAVPMIGYADAAGVSSVQLEYLAGVLQFNITDVDITGETAKLASVVIETVDGTPIAGVFDCDFATGTVKPQAGSRSSIDYSFGEEGMPVEVGASFHVAVPAGVYEAVKVLFIEQDGKTYEATLRAPDSKPIDAGQVREFSVTYKADKEYTVIKDATSLAAFAEAVKTTPDLEAIVLADVDASSIAADWTPIEGFTGLLRGNGKTISGLTKPLFDDLQCTVTNLTVNSTLVITTTRGGVFANTMSAGKIVNCVAHGSITYQRKSSVPHVGGFIGSLTATTEGLEITGCTNYCNIVIAGDTEGKTDANLYFGGIAGHVKSVVISNCENYGSITFNAIKGSDTARYLNAGGIVGGNTGNPATFIDCTNYGTITTSKDPACSISYVRAAGIIGVTNVASVGHNLTNNGDFSFYAAPRYWCGGIIGHSQSGASTDLANFSNCVNTGSITMSNAGSGVCYIGGCLGCIEANASRVIKDFHNRGNIILNETRASVVSRRMFVGGVIGYVNTGTAISYCSNEGNVIAPYYKYSSDMGTFIGLLCGPRYYHTGSSGTSTTPMISTADHCYIKGTIKRYKVDKSGNDEVEVDTLDKLYKYAFGEQDSYDGDTEPSKYITNCSATDPTVAQEPSTEE